MCQLGNTRVNAIYEYDIPSHVKKPTTESSRAARETFIRLKYAEHAFVHPHPNFERPEIPLPAPNFSELLTPSKSPHALHGTGGSSPKSPTRRSFSPSLKLRSPRLHKSHFSALRSSSHPSSVSEHSTPADSEEDLSGPQSGTMSVLAENLKKLEKSGKLKSWGGSNQSLTDKIRISARRSSKRLSTYAKAKLSEARERLRSKEKPVIGREVHSDAEDEDMATTSTPLLYSMSASTQNLTTYSMPPPKPPRTFATKRLSGISASDDESDLFKDSGDFSDILSAIKEMGVLCKSTDYEDADSDSGLPNGRIPESKLSSKLKKSESSPQLSHDKVNKNIVELPATQSNGNSPRMTPLNTIDEDLTTKQEDSEEIDGNHLAESTVSVDLPPDINEPLLNNSDSAKEIKVSSAPLQRKQMLGLSASFDAATLSQSTLSSSEGNIPASVQADSSQHPSISKRYSILSTTSADFFSADSSEASDSKVPSISVSPDIPSYLPAPVDTLRAPSRSSIEDECFSTPPTTPTLTDTRNTLGREEKLTYQVTETDHMTEAIGTEVVDGESEIVNETKSLDNEKQNGPQNQVTADDATGMTTSSQPPRESESHAPLSSPTGRKRSLTVSDSLPPLSTLPHVCITRSKDDNFDTEYRTKGSSDPSDSLVSSFSQQDMLDILGNEQMRIDPAVGQTLTIPEEIEEEHEMSSSAVSPEGSGGTGGISDGSPLPSEGSPDSIETVVIPDSVTPDEVMCVVCVMCAGVCSLCGEICVMCAGWGDLCHVCWSV